MKIGPLLLMRCGEKEVTLHSFTFVQNFKTYQIKNIFRGLFDHDIIMMKYVLEKNVWKDTTAEMWENASLKHFHVFS